MTDTSPFELRHLARIIDSSDDAIVSKDLNGIIQSWNRAAERMFGYTAEEAIGKSIRMIIPADRQGEEDHVLARVRAGEGLTHFETIRQRKDGTFLPISLTVSPVRDEKGVVIGASKIARDISDRIQGEVAMRRLSAVVASSDDAIVTKNLDSTITSWNKAAERMFGYTAEEAIGRSIRMLIPAELQSEEDTVLENIRAGRTVDHFETTRVRKDGTELTISLTVSPLLDETGRVVGASKIARDITEQTRLRAIAREQSLITEKIAEVGARIASSLDEPTIVAQVIELATSLTRAERGTFGPIAGDRVVRLDDMTMRPDDVVTTVERTAGHARWRSYLAVPVRTASGELLGGLALVHSRAGMFKRTHEQLAVGIASWAALALENSRLYVAARESDRLKDEFLAVLSHELRTPLNAILGYARLLRGGVLSSEKAERGLETLERNATSLTQIVEDVLDISRIVAGKIRLDVQPVELPLVIHNAVATVKPAADAKNIQLVAVVDPRVGPIAGDPDRLQQVVWNLLSNAVKFTPKGGRAQIRLEAVNSHVEIVVSDSGIGIRPDFLPFVFERFRQADAGTTRQTGGLGLGLSIVRHIVEMHGGSVRASSEGEGRGSTFRVRLPLMIVQPERAAEARQHPRTESRAPLGPLGDLTGIRVLAIDDEPDALQLLRAVLEAAGAAVTTLSSPVEALDRVAAIDPHVLVVDLGMPEMDGFQFIGKLRASEDASIRDRPAVALTAFARSEDRTRALQSGFEMHLAKPVDPGELVASLATLMRRTRRRAE